MEDDRAGEEELELSDVNVPDAVMPELDVDILREIHQAEKGDYFYVKREEDYFAIQEYLDSFNPKGLSVEHKPKLGFRIMRYGN